MTFLHDLGSAMNRTTTENGAETLRTTGNPLVDFFALAGATRGNQTMGLDLFLKAFAYDRQGAIRVLFYLRDIRGGQGERALFRNCLGWLAENEKEITDKIVSHVPEYGRFDDLWGLQIETFLPIVQARLILDNQTDAPSLLAKWMPSENTSSQKTRTLARGLRKALGMDSKEYRKTLSALRKKIKLVEQVMSKKEWGTIEYGKIPSQASLKYRKAFKRNDEARYSAYLESVTKGDTKINASTLYPYQIYEKVERGDGTATEQLWNALPDYTQGKNALVVADVSRSMSGQPMSVSVSLALYFAERNQGQFKDYFITFTGSPTLQRITGKTLRDRMMSIERADWEQNTNLKKVFDVILTTAVANHTPVEEMPSTIYVISDMEFDQCIAGGTNFDNIERGYQDAGYTRPTIVFWNVDARQKQVPVGAGEKNVALVSGFSPSAFKLAVEHKTPLEVVTDLINSERYSGIVI